MQLRIMNLLPILRLRQKRKKVDLSGQKIQKIPNILAPSENSSNED